MSQTNVKTGRFVVLAGEDLTGMEDRLVMLTHDTGVPEVKLPAANDDAAVYLLLEGAADTENVSVDPIQAGQNYRVVLDGTCNPGDKLVLADGAGTAAKKGKVRALPAAAGTYRVLGIAESSGVDGQLVLMRAASLGFVTVI
ncbi:MAG: hypothetical protein KA248_13775 [Kiritimatiellae bacterium]|nr:hypothetical protein [Kiritimatiellia bacterium]